MSFLAWITIAGILLLLMSLASGWIYRGPVSSFGLWLFVGVLLGPWMLNWLSFDIVEHAALITHITEVTMAVSLFITGLKLRLPLFTQSWRLGVCLALPTMLLTVAGIMLAAHLLIGLSWSLALAFGAIVAPTDPVLANLIAVHSARDDDALKVALSSEAGLNDGTALPLLLLAMMLVSSSHLSLSMLGGWLTSAMLWAVGGGIIIGYLFGRFIGSLIMSLHGSQNNLVPNDFLALALIALSYAAAQHLGASGFLATFAAGVGLRRTELRVLHRHPPQALPAEMQCMPAEELVNPLLRISNAQSGKAHSIGWIVGDALMLGDTLERYLAAAMMITLGITISQHWDADGLLMAALLFLLIRPLAVLVTTQVMAISATHRLLMSWLGIRGIGSINYAAFALMHGLKGSEAQHILNMTLTLVVASILIHGATVTPLLNWRATKLDPEKEKL